MNPANHIVTGMGVASLLFMQATDDLFMDEQWAKLLMQGGALLLVGWLVIQTFRVTIPHLTDTFSAESRCQRDLFEKTIKELEAGFVREINEMFITEIRQQRREFREELDRLRAAFVEIIALSKLPESDTKAAKYGSELTPTPHVSSAEVAQGPEQQQAGKQSAFGS